MGSEFLTSPFDNLLKPVDDHLIVHNELMSSLILGNRIQIHSSEHGIPDLDTTKIVIIGIPENRNSIDYLGDELNLNEIRKSFYNLYPGNWSTEIADLGNLILGENVEQTYGRIISMLSILFEKNIIPIIIGGSHDLLYANYRAYDSFKSTVNIVNIDSNFDIGDSAKPINNLSYLGKIILDEPHNLFNYSNLGYQTYHNSQEEIDLMENLYFESYRLGEVCSNIRLSEPVMRDADIVSIDLKSVRASELSSRQKFSPNGFDGKEICSLSRYAGISNKVSSFGIYEYKSSNEDEITEMLISQIVWYFIEGVNCRIQDSDFQNDEDYNKFTVIVDEYELVFYQNKITSRWWIEIIGDGSNNKLKQNTLLPCTLDDYEVAKNGMIPERWFKAIKKNVL
ncbi:MAG: formimidoylglutamase [Flavobacteriaceae bacterium]|nr:formimidoylglutamase [Flavobacteriaceae bacterium]